MSPKVRKAYRGALKPEGEPPPGGFAADLPGERGGEGLDLHDFVFLSARQAVDPFDLALGDLLQPGVGAL